MGRRFDPAKVSEALRAQRDLSSLVLPDLPPAAGTTEEQLVQLVGLLGATLDADGEAELHREALAIATRFLADALADRHPGRAVEVRIPPFAAVQILEGTVHRRGTPPAVVEMSPVTWLRLATGRLAWAEAPITASGGRSDLSGLLPILA